MGKDDILSLERVFSAIKRGQRYVFISTAVFLSVATLYVSTTTPQYTSMTSILLDPAQAKTVSDLSSKVRRGTEKASMLSQVELVKSRRILEKALQYLYSDKKMEEINNDFVRRERAISGLKRGLRVYREGESYILNIKYMASDPNVAADRANALAEAYVYDQMNFFSEGSEKTVRWLRGKIEQLRQDSIQADIGIQKFRVKNNLINTGSRTVTEQQLIGLNSKLGDTKAATASAYVKYMHSQDIIDKEDMSAAVAEAFDNDVINNIRREYISDQQRLLKLVRTLGPEHRAVTDLKKELKESQNVIFSEMRRITKSYQNQYEVMLAKEKSLEVSLEKLINIKVKNDGQIFELEALEKEAEVLKNIHNDYLAKLERVSQQESYPVAESRIISRAVAPLRKSHPKSFLLIGVAIILGIGFGVFVALLMDNFDKSFKRAGQVESAAGLFFLGFFPQMSDANIAKFRKALGKSIFSNPQYTQSVSSPLSLQAETCRNIKSILDKKDNSETCKVIGVISDSPHVGKSIAASNLALFIAQSQKKCLLIDSDLRNPVLSSGNFKLDKGLAYALSNKSLDSDVLLHDQVTNLYVLPADKDGQSLTSAATADDMRAFLESCKKTFDYIIIDLPPLSATSDASGLSKFIDNFLLVLEWGKSKPNSLNFHIKQSDIPKDKVLGAVLGQADMNKMVKNYDHNIYPEYTSI